jgi:hypothetical protein
MLHVREGRQGPGARMGSPDGHTQRRTTQARSCTLDRQAEAPTIVWMPTVLRSAPCGLFSYSSDRTEPPHVHVEREDKRAKFWLKPVRLEDSVGFRRVELQSFTPS